MMSSGGRNSTRFPFTAAQWQELEHQALVYKYMVSGMPVPPDLLFTIRRSLDSSLSSKFLLHQPPQHTIGWNSCFQMGFGRKIDPEPGRCRRTDGKKWRCSKEAYPDSKYCERHMHRGRNRSRKPVENNNNNTSSNNMFSPTPSAASATTTTNSPPTAIPISSKHGPIHSSSSPSSQSNISYLTSASESHFLYPHFSRPPSINLTSQDHTTTNFFLDSNATNYSHPPKDYRDSYGHGMKRETNELGHGYISDQPNANSGTISRTATVHDSVNWHLQAPALTMGSSQQSQMKPHNTNSALHSLNIENTPSFIPQKHDHHHQNYYYHSSSDHHLIDQPKKIMHHFLDDGPGPKDNKDSSPWPQDDKISSQYRTTTQLSISTPNSLHDFFMTQKCFWSGYFWNQKWQGEAEQRAESSLE